MIGTSWIREQGLQAAKGESGEGDVSEVWAA